MDGVDFGFEWFSQNGQVSMREEDWETVAGLLKHLQLNVDAKDAEIERLREPTEEMTIAGGRSLRDSMNDANFAARARTCFKAMRGV